MTFLRLTSDLIWLFLSLMLYHNVLFQAFQNAGLDLLQPDVAEVKVIPGIPGIAEAYHLDKKEVGLLFLGLVPITLASQVISLILLFDVEMVYGLSTVMFELVGQVVFSKTAVKFSCCITCLHDL